MKKIVILLSAMLFMVACEKGNEEMKEAKVVVSVYDENGKNVEFNVKSFFKGDIEEQLIKGESYYLSKTNFLKISIYKENTLICFYGGGIKNEIY